MTWNQQGIVPGLTLSSVNKPVNIKPRQDKNPIRRNQSRTNRRYIPRTPKFEGCTAKLKGHIYDAGYAIQANLFVTMIRELAEYTQRTCNNSGNICLAILQQEDMVFKLPTLKPEFKCEDTTEVAAILIQKEYDIFVKHKAIYKQNKIYMYAISYGQHSKAMRA
eukprot:9355049-Ditylum_brightwellii.AAC.1